VYVILYKITFFINLFYYEEKIMDKKILLGGVAALLMSGAMFTAPASAAIDVSMSGEAKLTATFNDACSDSDVDLSTSSDATADNVTSLSAHTACSGNDSDDMPVWATTSKLEFGASGTLANGLGVSVDLGAGAAGGAGSEIALSGAFGSIAWKDGGDSAVKIANVGGDGDISVAGSGFSGHALATAGTSGYVVSYAAPSMGGMNLYVTYAPSSNNSATNSDEYLDTIAMGAKFATDTLSISAGWESASLNSNRSGQSGSDAKACDHGALTIGATYGGTAEDIIDDVYGTDECGDQSLMMIGASMSAGDVTISGAYSNLDTDEADRATTSVDLGTSVGDWSVGLAYTTATRSSKVAGADTTQTAIGASLGTSLGDGVDFALKLSNNEYDSEAQSTARGGNGATNDFQAIGELKITY
jgi:predicted porin